MNDSDKLIRISEVKSEQIPFNSHPFMSGLVTRIVEDKFYILTVDGMISIKLETQGDLKVKLGDRLTNRLEDLLNALNQRAFYKSNK